MDLCNRAVDGKLVVSPASETTYTLKANNGRGSVSTRMTVFAEGIMPQLQVTEWMADSAVDHPDLAGNNPDKVPHFIERFQEAWSAISMVLDQ